MSNNINGIFTLPTSCSPSQPINHTPSHPGHQYYNQITPSLIWLEGGALQRKGSWPNALVISPEPGKTISTPLRARRSACLILLKNPPKRCTALQVQITGPGAQCQWKPGGQGEVPKSCGHKFTRFEKNTLSNTLPLASPLIMHSKSEQQDKQSDNSLLLSAQGEASQSCCLQQRSKGHKTVPFPIIICFKTPYGQVKQSEL